MHRQPFTRPVGIDGIIEGVRFFQSDVFGSHRERFEALAKGQRPEILLIACSDSRIIPEMITQTLAGDLFVLRNAGNIVPAHGASAGGEPATIEYAVTALDVRHVIVCGHSHCGAMKGLLRPETLSEMPRVSGWLAHAEATRRIVDERHRGLDEEQRVLQAAKENVLVQMTHLLTYPSICAKRAQNQIQIHGWMYLIESGEILSYKPEADDFARLV